jgi:homoserine kinase type II
MAVFCKINSDEAKNIISTYSKSLLEDDNDQFIDFEEISQGSENSNFLLIFKSKKAILTIFEERTNKNNISFYTSLHNLCNGNGLKCPFIYKSNDGSLHNIIKNKLYLVASFLNGTDKKLNEILDADCFAFGAMLAKFHKIAKGTEFTGLKNKNEFWVDKFKIFYEASLNLGLSGDLKFVFEKYLNFALNLKIKHTLPFGIIHADPFPDNVFFESKTSSNISGMFDFYFSCNGYLLYDLCIAVSSWCFDHENNFYPTRMSSLIKGYNSERALEECEKHHLKDFLIIACLRFLSTRTYDKMSRRIDTKALQKDPMDFVKRCEILSSTNVTDILLTKL